MSAGKVYLVGAGPGDPGLITVRGSAVLGAADVVLYDALASPRLLDLAPESAERVLVGKRHGLTTVSQEEIERCMVEYALAGNTVVRLKGGDPFLFGRGGEEAEACRSAGVAFEVVPGVSSAFAVPAYAGIPLTHREHASSVTILTGRPGDARGGIDYDWQTLAASGETLVFMMATIEVERIVARLLEAGMPASTPAAAVRWGTTPRQRTVRSDLGGFAAACTQAGLRPPTVIVIGEVAALADSLAWYEQRPLFGRRIVVTRPRHQARKLADRLEALGAEVYAYPTVAIAPPSDTEEPRRAFAQLKDYDWLVLTSVNGVERFFDGLREHGTDVRDLAGAQVAAIGPATAEAVRARGLCVSVQPTEYRAEALLEAIGAVAGKRVLLARAEVAREVLPDQLRERGAQVDVVSMYRSVVPADTPPLENPGDIELLTFTSSSTVENFVALNPGNGEELLRTVPVAAIGPITAETLARYGARPAVMPARYTVPDLCDAVVRYFATRSALD